MTMLEGNLEHQTSLTRVQRVLLASHLAFPESGHQNAAFLIRLSSPIDPAAVAEAFASVVAQSDVLRTRILKNTTEQDIEPVQLMGTEIIDSDPSSFADWAAKRAHQPIDLSVACYESVIARHPSGEASWYLNLHHLVSDGPSAALVLRAVDAAYQGRSFALSSFYTVDRCEAFNSPQKDVAQQNWKSRQEAPRIERIYDHLDRSGTSAEQCTALAGSEFNQRLSDGLSGPYRLLTPGLSRSAFWVFCTALYLHRLSGADTFSIGVIVNHRERLAAADVVGPMFEIFPVDITIHGDESHQSLHKRISQAFFETLKNAQPGTAPAQDYDALVNVLPDTVAPDTLFGGPAEVCWLYSGSLDGAVPLRIMDTPYADLPAGDYNGQRRIDLAITDDARGDCSLDAVSGHFETLVNRALSSPQSSAFDYSLASKQELTLASAWGSEPALSNPPAKLSVWLQETLEGNQDIVLVEEDVALTGDALWQWSLSVAGHLIRTKAPLRVGVQMTPSIQSLVAVYGILLSGRSYVPIEPTSPDARIKNIVETTELTSVFTSKNEIEQLRDAAHEPVPDWDADAEAYVFFTSGSTGEPRGVAITHAGLDNYLNVIVDRVRRRAGAPVAPLFGSLSFDITVNMLFAPILAGGKLIVFGGHPADAMVRIAKTPDLTWLQATPSHLELLVRLLPKDHKLRTIISGGDAMGGRIARLLDQSNPNADILIANYYGPTETVVGCIDYELTKEDRAGSGAVPIGKPLPGASLMVMDHGGHPVPPGAIGELWISFPHMMDAYIGWEPVSSGLTSFEGKRFYKSGDLVQYTPQGDLKFHGRADHQMKIGGIRIDPNEIEEGLLTHPQVRRAIVKLVQNEDLKRPTLTAWIVPKANERPSDKALRDHLAPRVPTFAIPRVFHEIEQVPLTSSGKIDFRRLPVDGPERSNSPSVSDRTEASLEDLILGVWQTSLKRTNIDPSDDFFELGGDSLTALEMIFSLGDVLGRRLDERLAFRETTIATLADAIRVADAHTATSLAPSPVMPVCQSNPGVREYSADSPPPLTDTELAILHHAKSTVEPDTYCVGRTFTVQRDMDPESLKAALEQTIARHIPLCWSFSTPRRPVPASQRLEFTYDVERKSGELADRQVEELRRKPYDLENGPILRCHLQPLESNRTAITLMGHHIGFDYASFSILFRQVQNAIGDSNAKHPVQDFPSVMQTLVANCESGATTYWQNLDIPKHAPLRSMLGDVGESNKNYIEHDLVLPAQQLRHAAGGPVTQRALAAAAAALSTFLDGDVIDLALVTARDNDCEDEVVGCSTNPVPLWLTCPENASLKDLMDGAAREISNVLPYRHFPILRVDAERRKAGKDFVAPRFLLSVVEMPRLEIDGEKVEETILIPGGAVAPASFFLILDGDVAKVGLEFDHHLIPKDVAQQITKVFACALEVMAQTPQTTVKTLCSEVLQDSVLIGTPLESSQGIFEQISGWLTRGDTDNAVECEDRSFTWSELAKYTHALASRLEEKGIGPGSRVAIALPRGRFFIAAILAVMARRAAFVPIDNTYPEDYVRSVLDIANPQLCLANAEITGVETLLINEAGIVGGSSPAPTQNAFLAPEDNDIAYILFTSGSTGTPNGVAIKHCQLSHSTNARQIAYDTAPKRFGVLSSFAFDSSIVGLFWTLAQGGTIVLSGENTAGTPRKLTEFLGKDLSHTLLVPTLYQAALDVGADRWPAHVILAGEAVSQGLVLNHFAQAPDTKLTNEYGPTEGTVWSLWQHISPEDDTVAIGQPVPGTWAAIVDENGAPCPSGVIGNLIIGGPLVADGYVSDAQASKAKFFEPSDPGLPTGPAFRTGDLVALTRGRVQYLGRSDHQLNVGGVRLEPTQIEAILETDLDVQKAVIVAHDRRTKESLMADASVAVLERAIASAKTSQVSGDTLEAELRRLMPGGSALVAHVQSDRDLDVSHLIQLAVQSLPPAQRPTDYVVHSDLPRLPNGKIDRRKLSTLPVDQNNKAQIAPSTTAALVETDGAVDQNVTAITEIFRSALKSPRMGPDESFFEYGGYSLLAMRVLLEIEEKLGLDLSTADLYERPTANALARVGADQAVTPDSVPASRSQHSVVIPFRRTGKRTPIFAVHSLGTNGSLYRDLVQRLGADWPVYGIGHAKNPNMSKSWVTDPDWHTNVEDASAEYVARLEEIAPSGPITLIGHCLGAVFAYEIAQQLHAKGRTPECLIMVNDLHAPDLEIGKKNRTQAILASRLDQIRRTKFKSVLVGLKKIPIVAVRVAKELERYIEIQLLKRAKSQGRSLSLRLHIREFVEESYLKVRDYNYKPYSGRTLVFRNRNRSIANNFDGNSGWGNLIPNSRVEKIRVKEFQSMLGGENADKIADLIKAEGPSTDVSAIPAPQAPTDKTVRRKIDRKTFQVSLEHQDAGFFEAPRPEQRDWHVQLRLNELAEELEHLGQIAPTMTPANGSINITDRARLKLNDDEIMEDWMVPLMQKMADAVAPKDKHILEIGFGRGISAEMVQKNGVASHTIVDCNPHIIENLNIWRQKHPGRDIRVIDGLWQHVTDQFGTYDGILFHTYPLGTDELVASLEKYSTFAEEFFPIAEKHLRPGGCFTYFTNEADSLSRAHQRALLQYFDSFSMERLSDLKIPNDSADAHWFSTIVVVRGQMRKAV